MCVCVIGLFPAKSRLGREGRELEFGRYRICCLHALLSAVMQELTSEQKGLGPHGSGDSGTSFYLGRREK